MRLFQVLLYSILFSINTLHALYSTSPCTIPNGYYTVKTSDGVQSIIAYLIEEPNTNLNGQEIYSCDTSTNFTSWVLSTYDASKDKYSLSSKFLWTVYASPTCTPPQILSDDGSQCVAPPNECLQSPVDNQWYQATTTPTTTNARINGADCYLSPNTLYYSTYPAYHEGEYFTFGRSDGCSGGTDVLRDVNYYGLIPCDNPIPISDMDDDSDGILNKCDNDYIDFNSMDCDGDSILNDSDLDIDGDSIPNDYDSNSYESSTADEIENSPTCAEMEAISEQKCLYPLRWQFDCTTVQGGVDYVTKDICPSPSSPCMDFTDTLIRNCNLDTHTITGTCSDDGVTVVRNNQKCEEKITELTEDDCSRSWHEVFNATTKQCECESGYTINTWGDCWKSPTDENSTTDEILLDERNQAINNEVKTEEENKEAQQLADNEASLTSAVADETTNNTLSGIRDDLSESISNDNRRDDLLTEIKDLLSSDSNSSSTGSLDFLTDSVDSILSKYTINLTNGSCGAISTVSANILNQNVVFLSQDTIDMLPMDYMKSIVIFLFTVSALILAFRGGD